MFKSNSSSATVQFPLDSLRRHLAGRRVGVIAAPASWLPGAGPFTDWLAQLCDVRGFLALEHGLRGELQDGALFDTYTDRSGKPVFSFYAGSHTFPAAFMKEIDVIVFHVQDVTHRAYTYQWTLADTLVAAAAAGVEVVVLDRPTPLAHFGTQGPSGAQFFPLPFPVLSGLTHGELALWLKAEQKLDVALTVLPADNWQRSQMWEETGLPWIPPSPNIPQPVSAYAYACTGIIQAGNVSEGRGTCKPFEYIGAPFIQAESFAAQLNAAGLPGIHFRELYFKPGFNKFAGEVCAGVHLLFTDCRALQPMRTMMVILQTLARQYPDSFTLTSGFPEWLDQQPWSVPRLAALDLDAWLAECAQTAAAFRQRTAPLELYGAN